MLPSAEHNCMAFFKTARPHDTNVPERLMLVSLFLRTGVNPLSFFLMNLIINYIEQDGVE